MKNKKQKLSLNKLQVNSFKTSEDAIKGGLKPGTIGTFDPFGCNFTAIKFFCETGNTCPECAYTLLQPECALTLKDPACGPITGDRNC